MNRLKKETGADKVIIAMGGISNFRDRLPLLHKYKDRKDAYRPSILKEVRALLKELFDTEISNDCEADDIISMYQYKGCKDQSYIVITEDKDAKQTPGYVYNPRKMEIKDCNGFGKLELITKVSTTGNKTYKLDGSGRLWFYYQLVCGDKVDTYHPFPKVISDLSFYNKFKDFTTDAECWFMIAALYKAEYADIKSWVTWDGNTIQGDWIDLLQAYVDVVHMRRWSNDRIDTRKVLKKFGII